MQLSDRGYFYNVFFFVSMLQASFLGSAGAKDVCFGCHSVQGMKKIKDGKTISLQIEQERFEPSVHGAFECTACHSDGALFWHLAGIVMSQQRRQRLKEQDAQVERFSRRVADDALSSGIRAASALHGRVQLCREGRVLGLYVGHGRHELDQDPPVV
jgi:hypothetical protein